MNATIQMEYKILKLRSLFLLLKGLLYDFEFLGYYPENSKKIINEGISLRENYFKNISDVELIQWFYEFYDIFHNDLKLLLDERDFFYQAIKLTLKI